MTDAVARRTGLDPDVVASVLHGLQSVVTEQLLHGCPVRLTGFVSFLPATGRAAHDRPRATSGRAGTRRCEPRQVEVRAGRHLRRAVEGA